MKISPLVLISTTLFLSGCVPKVALTVETRDPQNNVIDRADVTNSDSSGHTFRADVNGTVNLTATAQTSDGLQAMRIEGGYDCSRQGVLQQGTYSANDPNLPGQHPTTETYSSHFAVMCSGGTYSGTFHACATDTKNGSTCTKDATLHAP